MTAAAARTSGTRSPLASTLYRGNVVSAISLAKARARASLARCASERCEEYSGRLRDGDALAARVETDDWDFVFVAALVELTPMLQESHKRNETEPNSRFCIHMTQPNPESGGTNEENCSR